MTARARSGLELANGWLQTIVLLCGLAALAMKAGSRDNQLETNTQAIVELRGIVYDLAKSQVGAALNDAHQQRLLEDLTRRLERLEQRRAEANP